MKPQLMFGAVMQITTSLSLSAISIQLAGFPSTQYADKNVFPLLAFFRIAHTLLPIALTAQQNSSPFASWLTHMPFQLFFELSSLSVALAKHGEYIDYDKKDMINL